MNLRRRCCAASERLAGRRRGSLRRRFRPEGSIKGSIPTSRSRTCNSIRQAKVRYAGLLQSPLTDSNRRPPPYHEREEGADSCGIPCRGACSRVSGSSTRRRVLRRRATLVRPPPGGAILLPDQMLGSLGTWRFGGWTTSESSLTALRAMTLVFPLSLP